MYELEGKSISVLLGVGDRTFHKQIQYTVGTYPLYVTDGSFKNNTTLDLAVINAIDNNSIVRDEMVLCTLPSV